MGEVPNLPNDILIKILNIDYNRKLKENKNKYNNFIKTFKYLNLVLKDFYFQDEDDEEYVNHYYDRITLYKLKISLKDDYIALNKTLKKDFDYLN